MENFLIEEVWPTTAEERAMPTRNLSKYSLEFHRRSVLRISRVLHVKPDLNSQSFPDIIMDHIAQKLGFTVDARAEINRLLYRAAAMPMSQIRRDVEKIKKASRLQRRLSNVGLNIRWTVAEELCVISDDVVRTVKRLTERRDDWWKRRLPWTGVRYARNKREASLIFEAAMTTKGWEINILWDAFSHYAGALRRAARLKHEGRVAFFMWASTIERSESPDWGEFRQWWQENRVAVLENCDVEYLKRIAPHDDMAAVALASRERGPEYGAYVAYKIGKPHIAPRDGRHIVGNCKMWVVYHNRLPSFETVSNVPEDIVPELNIRHFIRAARYAESIWLTKEDAVECAARIVSALGGQWKRWASEMEEIHGLNFHDIAHLLPDQPSPGLDRFLMRFKQQPYRDLKRIASVWNILEDKDKASFRKALDAAMALRYENVKDKKVAAYAAEVGMDQEKFEKYQRYWSKRKRKKMATIPSVTVRMGKYTFTRLADDDPRGPMLGLYTDCCQHLTGAGKSCARHGTENDDGAFFVVFDDKDHIVAQSWAWRNGDTLCFDNIEALGKSRRVLKLYLMAAKELIGRFGIRRVTVGTGNSDVNLDNLPDVENPPKPPKGYTDAEHQKLLAEAQDV